MQQATDTDGTRHLAGEHQHRTLCGRPLAWLDRDTAQDGPLCPTCVEHVADALMS